MMLKPYEHRDITYNIPLGYFKLEMMFMKHYAPNPLLVKKG